MGSFRECLCLGLRAEFRLSTAGQYQDTLLQDQRRRRNVNRVTGDEDLANMPWISLVDPLLLPLVLHLSFL
jgi:hypothetical protein